MDTAIARRGAGRKSKDEALKLRCQYVALHVASREPRGYAYLDEVLPAGEGPAGDEGTGSVAGHQGLWGKRARGAKGFSHTIGDVPDLVRRTEQQYPGTLGLYQSALWDVLWASGERAARLERIHWKLPDSVRAALSTPGAKRSDNALLTSEELVRVGELTSLDAFGWLLMHTIWQREAGWRASVQARQMYARLVAQDSEFAAVGKDLAELVQQRFGVALQTPPPPPPAPKAAVQRALQVRQSALEYIAQKAGVPVHKTRAAQERRMAQALGRFRRQQRLEGLQQLVHPQRTDSQE